MFFSPKYAIALLTSCYVVSSQVKGLSIEHEKLAVVQGQHVVNHDAQLDSPTGRKTSASKLNSNGSGSKESLVDAVSSGSGEVLQHHPPSTSSYSPVLSPYSMHPPHYRPAYEQRVPPSAPPPTHYDACLPRKRQHRSSSEVLQDSAAAAAAVRASVLRDGSKATGVAYRPALNKTQENKTGEEKGNYPHMRYDAGGPDARDNAAANAAASAATAVTFDRTAAVDGDANNATSDGRRSSVDPGSSCPEGKRFDADMFLLVMNSSFDLAVSVLFCF